MSSEIEIFANDRNGLLADIVQKINESKAKLLGVNAKATKERVAVTEVTLEIDSLESLNKILRELRKISNSMLKISMSGKWNEKDRDEIRNYATLVQRIVSDIIIGDFDGKI